MQRAQLNEIIDLLSPILADHQLECLDAEWVQGDDILRVYIDSEAGVNIDDCVKISRELEDNAQLDGMIEGAYHLEVSSPGIERPVRTMNHFEKIIGQRVEVKLTEKIDGRIHSVGQVEEVDHNQGMIKIETGRGAWVFPIDKLASGRLKYNWEQAQQK